MKHDARLQRLERTVRGDRIIYVVRGPAEMDAGAAADALGIEQQENDLLIYLKHFGQSAPPPRLLYTIPPMN